MCTVLLVLSICLALHADKHASNHWLCCWFRVIGSGIKGFFGISVILSTLKTNKEYLHVRERPLFCALFIIWTMFEFSLISKLPTHLNLNVVRITKSAQINGPSLNFFLRWCRRILSELLWVSCDFSIWPLLVVSTSRGFMIWCCHLNALQYSLASRQERREKKIKSCAMNSIDGTRHALDTQAFCKLFLFPFP